MSEVIIYTKPTCGYCKKAKHLLDTLGIRYDEREIGNKYTGEDVRTHCNKVNPGVSINSVPQIILVKNGLENYIGGYEDLVKLQHLLT